MEYSASENVALGVLEVFQLKSVKSDKYMRKGNKI